ncbi:hypothetical protein JCM16814_30590 [Desulfobaculum senezii]|jgi:AhpD family alkylhydroperoxidase
MDKSILDYEEHIWDLTNESREHMAKLNEAVYSTISPEVYDDGALARRDKSLMALAIAISQGCGPCIVSKVDQSLTSGASVQQIVETCQVAISMGGTLAWSNCLPVFDYLRAKDLLDTPEGA